MTVKVKMADTYGFCNGVKNSIALAEQTARLAKGNSVDIVGGEIVHNPDVTTTLKKKGIGIQPDHTLVKPGGHAVLRAHGVTPEVEQDLRNRKVNVADGTCPNVKKAQLTARDLAANGHRVILLGDVAHPETQGIIGYAGDNIVVVKSMAELQQLLPSLAKQKVALMSQTTKDTDLLYEMSRCLQDNIGGHTMVNTICKATAQKQAAAAKLANEKDVALTLAIGGFNSSNTALLAKIMGRIKPSHHIEGIKDLNPEWFKTAYATHKNPVCGITAGSSTPDSAVQSVVAHVRNITQ